MFYGFHELTFLSSKSSVSNNNFSRNNFAFCGITGCLAIQSSNPLTIIKRFSISVVFQILNILFLVLFLFLLAFHIGTNSYRS